MIVRKPSKKQFSTKIKVKAAVWWAVEAILFRPSLHPMNEWRCFLLRLFGAKIGENTFINSRAKIWFPWNFEIGSNSGVGFDALVYSLDKVIVGDYSTISQRCHVNTGSHDYMDPEFALVTKAVHIGDSVFLGADAYVNYGVSIANSVVVGARSVVVNDLPESTVCVGHPCKPIKSLV